MSKPIRLAIGGGGSRRSAIARRNSAPAIENAASPRTAGSCQVTIRVRSISLTSKDLLRPKGSLLVPAHRDLDRLPRKVIARSEATQRGRAARCCEHAPAGGG